MAIPASTATRTRPAVSVACQWLPVNPWPSWASEWALTTSRAPAVARCLANRMVLAPRERCCSDHGLVHGDQLGSVGKGRFDLDVGDHFGHALHHVVAGEHGAAV